MPLRHFHTSRAMGGIVEKWYSDEDGNITRETHQDTNRVVEAVHGMRDHAKGDDMYFLGSVPVVIAREWARTCGAAIGTREFAEYAKKQLMDSDWAKLSSGVKV